MPFTSDSTGTLYSLVQKAKCINRKIFPSYLGQRVSRRPTSKYSITAKLLFYLEFEFLSLYSKYDGGLFNHGDSPKARYDKVLKIAGDYVDDYIIQGGPAPAKWSDVVNHEDHEFIFEIIVFFYGRDVEVPEDLMDIYTELNDHLIPLHLMEDSWGSRGILQQAVANRRPSKRKGKGKDTGKENETTLIASASSSPETNDNQVIDIFYYKCGIPIYI